MKKRVVKVIIERDVDDCTICPFVIIETGDYTNDEISYYCTKMNRFLNKNKKGQYSVPKKCPFNKEK